MGSQHSTQRSSNPSKAERKQLPWRRVQGLGLPQAPCPSAASGRQGPLLPCSHFSPCRAPLAVPGFCFPVARHKQNSSCQTYIMLPSALASPAPGRAAWGLGKEDSLRGSSAGAMGTWQVEAEDHPQTPQPIPQLSGHSRMEVCDGRPGPDLPGSLSWLPQQPAPPHKAPVPTCPHNNCGSQLPARARWASSGLAC